MKDLGQSHNNLGDLVANEIRAAILSGAIAPGERLKQEKLAEDLNVSRIPVREALQTLEAEGLIDSFPGRGSRVAEVSPGDAADVLTVRGTLEGLAARLAAARVTSEHIEALRDVVEAGRMATLDEDHSLASDLHTRFHLELARASGNSHLYDALAVMPAKTGWINSSLLKSRGTYSWDEHGEIVDAVASGQADLAETLMRQHAERLIANVAETKAGTLSD